jgi:nickel-dependent lactate racemase
MDDLSRPTPVDRLAPVVLDVLIGAGPSPDNITGLFAIGTHEVMSPTQMEKRAGATVASRIACRSFECHDRWAPAYLGETERGTAVHINRIAAQVDLRIPIGTVKPHPQAGFGGGFKDLLPGPGSAESIGHNHLLLPSPERYNLTGTEPRANPMRLDLEEAGRLVGGPTLIVNTVLDPSLNPVSVVCGDAAAAHRVGVRLSRKFYGVEVPQRADVVVTSAYLMDRDLRQAGKRILNVSAACQPGGVIVAFVRCEEALGNVALPRLPLPLSLARVLVRIVESRGIRAIARPIPTAWPEGRFLINLAQDTLKDYHVLVCSSALKRALNGRFTQVFYDDQERLFAHVERLVGTHRPEVLIFPCGGVSFPVAAT